MTETQHAAKKSAAGNTKSAPAPAGQQTETPTPFFEDTYDVNAGNILQFQRLVGNQRTVQLTRAAHSGQSKGGFISNLVKSPIAANKSAISRSIHKAPVQVSHTAPQHVQRNIMPVDVWKETSNVTFGFRPDAFEWIDEALATYHSIANPQKKIYQLSTIEGYIQHWERVETSPDKKRKQAVTILKQQIAADKARLGSKDVDKKKGLFQMWSPDDFEARTNQERAVVDAGKSVFQKQIITSLFRFHQLPDPSGADAAKALGIIYEMQGYIQGWLGEYELREKKNREQRKAGFIAFGQHIDSIKSKLEGMVDVSDIPKTVTTTDSSGNTTTRDLTDDEIREKKIEKIKGEHVGNAESLFSKIGGWVGEKLAPSNGSGTEIEVEVKIPVDPSATGFIGGKLAVKAERDDNQVKLRGEAAFIGGGKIAGLVELKGELGGYIEAQAKTAESAAKLMSYAMYRRFQQSRAIPRELHEYIWGGTSGSAGHKLAEQWAANVEKQIFGGEGGDDAFVESGGYGGITGKVGNEETLGGEASYKYFKGTRITKGSIEKNKGVGKTLSRPAARGGLVDNVGADASMHQISVKVNAGIFGGELEVKYGGLMTERELEIGLKGMVTLPGGVNLTGLLVNDLRALIVKIVEIIRTYKGLTGKTADETRFLGAGDALHVISSANDWQNFIRNGVSDPSGPLKKENKVELAVGYMHKFKDSANEFKVSLNSVNELKADLQAVSGGIKQTKRLFGFQYKDKAWSLI